MKFFFIANHHMKSCMFLVHYILHEIIQEPKIKLLQEVKNVFLLDTLLVKRDGKCDLETQETFINRDVVL